MMLAEVSVKSIGESIGNTFQKSIGGSSGNTFLQVSESVLAILSTSTVNNPVFMQ